MALTGKGTTSMNQTNIGTVSQATHEEEKRKRKKSKSKRGGI